MKARVNTTISKQLSYDRYDDIVKIAEFDENEPISEIRKWKEGLEKEQMDGTVMSPIRIEFIEEPSEIAQPSDYADGLRDGARGTYAEIEDWLNIHGNEYDERGHHHLRGTSVMKDLLEYMQEKKENA